MVGGLSLCKEAVGVFYSSSHQGNTVFVDSKLLIQHNPAVFWSVRNENEYCSVKNIFNCFLSYFVAPNILGYNNDIKTGLMIFLLIDIKI